MALTFQTAISAAQTVRVPDGRGGFVERRCEAAAAPKKLPAFDALVDSQTVAPLLARDSAVVLSISFDENGSVRGVRVLEPAAPSVRTDTLRHLLKTFARPQAPGQICAVRIRKGGIDKPTVTVERSLYCPPQRDPAGPRESYHLIQGAPGENPAPGRVRVLAEVSLSEMGDVLEVKLMQRSGVRDLDDSFVLDLQKARYFPALLDGESLPSWFRTNGQRMRL